MNELKVSEIPESKKSDAENYRDIRPENGMSVKAARDYWDSKFGKSEEPEHNENRRQEIVDGKVCYYDDNGKLYRTDKDLVSNCEYTINGYDYTTDDMGRIVSAEGKLRLKEHSGRKQIRDSLQDVGKGDELPTDNRGHLIGDRFDGSNGLENLIPQDAKENLNFSKLENQLAVEVGKGNDVKVEIKPFYDGESRRPIAIGVTYSINGEQSIRIFPNPNRKE
ncbi:MAG TPA: hypothetical protein DCZ91_08050 [Lachnospiraceae bacterium]|nr:hypothetical protein [Lachnospiraceae bacterium]